MKMWGRLLRLASDHRLFSWVQRLSGWVIEVALISPSLWMQLYIRCQPAAKTINPSLAGDVHIYRCKWLPDSVNTPVFHQPSACRSGWCIDRRSFCVNRSLLRGCGEKWQGGALSVKWSRGEAEFENLSPFLSTFDYVSCSLSGSRSNCTNPSRQS